MRSQGDEQSLIKTGDGILSNRGNNHSDSIAAGAAPIMRSSKSFTAPRM